MSDDNMLELVSPYPIKKGCYWISEEGLVYRKNAAGEYVKMKPFITKDGYVEYVLTRENGTKQHAQAQRLVIYTYKGGPDDPKKTQVNHEDGDRLNNAPDNLDWITPKENILHSFKKLGKVVWNKGLLRRTDK